MLSSDCYFLAVALADTGDALRPGELWSAWEFDPGVVLPLLISGLLYARGARVQRSLPRREHIFFWCGWAALAIALVSPLHPLGEALFSAHMVQHEVLMLIAAPFFVLSRPLATLLFAFPLRWRRRTRPLGENQLCPPLLDLSHRSPHRLVAPCRCHLDLARPLPFRSNPAKRAGSQRSTSQLLSLRSPLLVGAVLRAWPQGLWFRSLLSLHHRRTHQHPRRAPYLLPASLVFRLRNHDPGLGIDSSAGPADRRAHHVGPGRGCLSRRGPLAIRRLAQRKRCHAREVAQCQVDLYCPCRLPSQQSLSPAVAVPTSGNIWPM